MAPDSGRTRSTAQATAEGLRVFVASLPWKLDEAVIRQDFEECGTVEDFYLLRDQDGNSRGRAFVTYRDKAAVEAALAFDDTPYAGRRISVKLAEARQRDMLAAKTRNSKVNQGQGKKKKAEAEEKPSFPQEKPAGCVSLCLKNVGDANSSEICKLLAGCKVQAVRFVSSKKTGAARGIAFVDFASTEDVDKAMEYNGKEVKDGLDVEMYYEAPKLVPRPEGCLTVAVKKLAPEVKDKQLRKLFQGLDSILEVRIIQDKDKLCTSGLAFVEFTDVADVEAAVRRNGMSVGGRTVFVCYETKQKKERLTIDKSEAVAKKKDKSKKDKPKAVADASTLADGVDVVKKPRADGELSEEQLQRKRKRMEAKLEKQQKHAADECDEGAEVEASDGIEEAPKKKKKSKHCRSEHVETEAKTSEDICVASVEVAKKRKKKRKHNGVAKGVSVEKAAESSGAIAADVDTAQQRPKKRKRAVGDG